MIWVKSGYQVCFLIVICLGVFSCNKNDPSLYDRVGFTKGRSPYQAPQYYPKAYEPYYRPYSKGYVNPYYRAPRNYYPYYDHDQYYIPPRNYHNIEPIEGSGAGTKY